ncbi:hypothetical protein [Deinococcus ruber]|uniref:Uncharacterized protein n=1 Tax=Deinococcus ruber TaxID=1848197 RepID=A0A918C7K8_9DEIO|nr:hypothetical protein [Deinococcus ruber]GGR10535.1 hypothetical protein GCM10008957_24030 [Deinococcus ruber]
MPADPEPPQHPALPPAAALTPGDDWTTPEALPETKNTPAPLITAVGVTLAALGLVWPSVPAGVVGLVVLLAGVLMWLLEGLASWRAWVEAHPEERP